MDINRFIYLLLICSVFFVFYKRGTVDTQIKTEEKPVVVFNDSVMYDLSVDSIEYIIQSQKALIYKNHNEMYDAVIMSRVDKKNTDSVKVNNLSAKTIVKQDDNVYLNGDVRYNGYDGLIFKTESLQYNIETKIAKNDTYFNGAKDMHLFSGDSLYYDSVNKRLTSENTHFKIKQKDINENIN